MLSITFITLFPVLLFKVIQLEEACRSNAIAKEEGEEEGERELVTHQPRTASPAARGGSVGCTGQGVLEEIL